ncbi:aminoglycoside phosphotransferase family protein [Metabacillus dongyingensis]|uniref:aminoglycoside phosphotransferase family protein n=1 Tax=Metabacillus dongyingensis TaxID=2874282 RepID=UPI00308404C9|nr:phosphotransferase family protein [Metabacillus dongyingensis]
MFDIKNYATFEKIKPINKGWSSDKKYYIETVTNEKMLLRIADISEYAKKKSEFEMMKRLAEYGVPMSQPVDFGMCDNCKSVYMLLIWCDGEDAEIVLPKMTETEQYVLGIKSGRILRKIHSIPAPKEQEEWGTLFNRKTDNKTKKYNGCGIKIDGDDKIIAYVEANRHLLDGRPQCFQHGDYHVGNMIISPEGELSIIDFNRIDYGDPWEEFNRIVWSAAVSPHFATGQLNGYFNGRPPVQFFTLLAFYISSNTLSSIYWAIPFGEDEVTVMKNQAKDVLTWFDGMNNPVPTWYLADFYIQYINNIPYKLKSPFDISFIEQYGEIFKIYDDQDSGNICFGVENGDKRYFIKFAGAPTEQYSGKPEDAIASLKSTVPIYQDLAHPNLIRFIKAEEIGRGFAVIFEWTDGVCMGRMYPLSREKFLQMPDSTRLEVFNDILNFHIHIIKQGYIAIDFYDGSIMYDFDTKKTIICDIDLYSKMPYINTMGRMWGSSRFMSPEEFTLGVAIDEITNVYLMGATAFALFGREKDRSIEKWRLGDELYKVALKAVNDNRGKRQQSLLEFECEWNRACLI